MERADQEEVPSVLNTASETVVADVQELPPTVQTLYWVAPSPYLGDRVSYWGGDNTRATGSHLHFTFLSFN